MDSHGPVAGARVRCQGDTLTARTDAAGKFRLPAGPCSTARLAAWKQGYRIASAHPGKKPIQFLLAPLPAQDNDDFRWIDPCPNRGQEHFCADCHGAIYREWIGSAHARSAANPKLLQLYGNPHPGPDRKTWNLLAEYPEGAGVCASCHAPTYRSPTLDYDLRRVKGVSALGVHCDYCHKIVEAPTDKLGTRFGRDGLHLLRPRPGELLFFGPLADALPPGETSPNFREEGKGDTLVYSPLYKNSAYCASCHEGVIFGVHVYGTYSEWLESPARRQGQHCQDCHMTPTGIMHNIAPGKGGINRDPRTLASHQMVGVSQKILRDCLKVDVQHRQEAEGVRIIVTVRADQMGHRVPTGFIDRHLVLVVEVFDSSGQKLPLLQGPSLPAAAGRELSGQPGYLYAKILLDKHGEGPWPFWVSQEKMIDSRLDPDHPDRIEFVFPGQASSGRVRLIYRRFWPEVAQRWGWQDNEMEVANQFFTLPFPPKKLGVRRGAFGQ